jgi:hypothetical protein
VKGFAMHVFVEQGEAVKVERGIGVRQPEQGIERVVESIAAGSPGGVPIGQVKLPAAVMRNAARIVPAVRIGQA